MAGMMDWQSVGFMNETAPAHPLQNAQWQQMATLQGMLGQAAMGPQRTPVDAPKVSELARTTIVSVEPSVAVAAERLNLAEKAKKVLGYRILGEKITAEEKRKRTRWEVSTAFRKLGFDPLDSEKVAKYQNQMVDHVSWSASWQKTALDKYTDPVPEFALSRAIELKEELPSATFEVEHIVRNPDPFLVMVYGGERFYIDVWDEPMFEGRRTV